MSAPPVIYQGDAVFGKVYQTIGRDEKKPGYLRLVVGVAKDNDAVLNFIKEKVQPIYEESEGLQITGAIFDENTGISWSIWDSQAAMDEAATQLQNVLDSESESDLFDGATVAYMGPVYAGKLFVDFNKGDSPS